MFNGCSQHRGNFHQWQKLYNHGKMSYLATQVRSNAHRWQKMEVQAKLFYQIPRHWSNVSKREVHRKQNGPVQFRNCKLQRKITQNELLDVWIMLIKETEWPKSIQYKDHCLQNYELKVFLFGSSKLERSITKTNNFCLDSQTLDGASLFVLVFFPRTHYLYIETIWFVSFGFGFAFCLLQWRRAAWIPHRGYTHTRVQTHKQINAQERSLSVSLL